MDINSLALIISIVSALVAALSWRAAEQAARATIFDQRFEVYRDAEKFVGLWIRNGRPDIDQLGLIVDAWNRSHFLFDEKVTAHLREVWVDAVKAAEITDALEGGYASDHEKAVKMKHELLHKHCLDGRPLRKVFEAEMKVQSTNSVSGFYDWLSRRARAFQPPRT